MIREAQVVNVHPARRTLDLVFIDTGQPAAEVAVLCGTIGSDHGVWDVPEVPAPASQPAVGVLSGSARNIVAAVDFTTSGRPVVVGFLSPGGGQMVFTQQSRKVDRHPSGAYVTVAPDGSIEAWHPAGAYLRIGTGPHEDLAQYAANGNWSVPGGAPPAQVTLATSGFTLTVEPGGNMTLTSQGNGTLSFGGDITVKSGGDMTLAAGGNLNLQASDAIDATAPSINLN